MTNFWLLFHRKRGEGLFSSLPDISLRHSHDCVICHFFEVAVSKIFQGNCPACDCFRWCFACDCFTRHCPTCHCESSWSVTRKKEVGYFSLSNFSFYLTSHCSFAARVPKRRFRTGDLADCCCLLLLLCCFVLGEITYWMSLFDLVLQGLCFSWQILDARPLGYDLVLMILVVYSLRWCLSLFVCVFALSVLCFFAFIFFSGLCSWYIFCFAAGAFTLDVFLFGVPAWSRLQTWHTHTHIYTSSEPWIISLGLHIP